MRTVLAQNLFFLSVQLFFRGLQTWLFHIGLGWLKREEPSAATQIVAWRYIASILQQHLRDVTRVCSKKFEKQQAARSAKGEPRDFSVYVAARGDLEKALQQRLVRFLAASQIFILAPCQDHTNKTRSLLFRMASIVGGEAERQFGKRHRLYPFRAFLRFHGDYMGDILDQDRECMRSPCFEIFAKETGFKSEEALMRLYLKAQHASICNICAEQLFSRLRRRVKQRVQTIKISPIELSAISIGDRLDMRKDPEQPMANQDATAANAPAPSRAGEPSTLKHVKLPVDGRVATTWTAFVRENASNDLRGAGAKYKHLTADDMA